MKERASAPGHSGVGRAVPTRARQASPKTSSPVGHAGPGAGPVQLLRLKLVSSTQTVPQLLPVLMATWAQVDPTGAAPLVLRSVQVPETLRRGPRAWPR